MKKKKWLASLLAAVMVLTMLPCMAFAADVSDQSANDNSTVSEETEIIDAAEGNTSQESQTEADPVETTGAPAAQANDAIVANNGVVAQIGDATYSNPGCCY